MVQAVSNKLLVLIGSLGECGKEFVKDLYNEVEL